MLDFTNCKRLYDRVYNGANGKKIAIEYEGEPYMLKFPPSGENKPTELSYTNSCISEHIAIGKYGRMHREYLREVHPVRLNTLILTGELWTYLADLNEQAQERLDTIMEQMKIAEGVTEELKCTRQMEWVRRCNNIHNRAEEIVLHEMIYS